MEFKKESKVNSKAIDSPRVRKIPFLLFIALLGVIYISNANFSQKKLREIQQSKDEIKSLRWESMDLKSQLSSKTKRSQVMKSMAGANLKLPKQQLKKILVEKELD